MEKDNLIPVNTDELKKIQLEILDFVAGFCDKNHIKYWLDCGTLLGAIRHNGYIPWDDDIDIGMLREDYDKFSKLFHDPSGKYFFNSVEKDKNFYIPYGKVMDSTTILYEPDETGIKNHINIDVFVYDNVPNSDKIRGKLFDKRDRYYKLRDPRLFAFTSKNGSKTKQFLRKIKYCPLLIFPKNYFTQKIAQNSKKYINTTSNRVGNLMAYTKMYADKHIFDSFMEGNFEGKKYPIPIGYDKWLTAFYGDYMKLPPKNQQHSHHSFKAYKTKGEKL